MPPKKKPSILFIDPDKHLTEILLTRFQKEGWTGRAAKSIEQAKKMLARKVADILVIDPKHEILFESEIKHLLETSTQNIKTWIIYTTTLTHDAQIRWKQLGASVLIRKGESSLADFVKKIKKYGNTTTKN